MCISYFNLGSQFVHLCWLAGERMNDMSSIWFIIFDPIVANRYLPPHFNICLVMLSRNCPKAYHLRCLDKKHGFLTTPDDQFVCDWHICFNCRQSSRIRCLCCPISVCHDCLGKVGFLDLRMQQKGFCTSCLNKAIFIEKNADPDSRWVQRDFSNAEIYDILFKDYWEDVKDREHLKLVYLEEAHVILIRKLDCNRANSEKFPDEGHKSDANIFAENAPIEKTIPFDSNRKQNKVNRSLKKKNKSNKKTYIGWGSEELIDFLSGFGKDTSKSLYEAEIVRIIMGHVKKEKLFNDNKKNSFSCDGKLYPLFRRKKVRCKRIRRFLANHLAANVISEDENSDGSEDDDVPITKKKPRFDGSEDDDFPIMKKKPRNAVELKISKRVSEKNKRCFASLNENNIKLIYLRRSLVINLLNHLDTFDQKVVGCFVRVKNAPRVHMYEKPKMPYQLGLVTGIKKSSEEYRINDTCTNILLCVTGLWDDVRISMLSDEDFLEEECNDLVSLVKKGLLERHTIAALEEKVATVHKDIVNHWIDRELVRLERAIDRAHIKGWRQEFEDLMQQQKLLSTEAERTRRLEEVPEIIADTEQEGNETEPEVAASNSSQENRGNTSTSLPPLPLGAKQQVANALSDIQGEPPKGKESDSASCFMDATENSKGNTAFLPSLSPGAKQQVEYSLNGHQEEPPKENVLKCLREEKPTKDGSSTEAMGIAKDESEYTRCKNSGANIEEAINLDSDEDEDLHIVEHRTEGNKSHALRAMNGGHLYMQQPKSGSLIALHAQGAMNGDLHLEQHGAAVHAAMNAVSPLTPLWNYVDPQGHTRGPFPLSCLFRWSGFFAKDFKVWRTGETAEQAILLTDAFLMYL
nr:uncharacterized protein At5g08430-like isoform X4 [Setaria viridis]